MVSLAVAVGDGRDGTILGHVPSLPPGSPGPIIAGKVLGTLDRSLLFGGKSRACHFHFNIFRGVMSRARMASASVGLTARAHAVPSQICSC